jgi:rhomboid family GlyGly-CTERM serine protease
VTLRSDRIRGRLPIVTLAVAALTLVAGTFEATASSLQLDRAACASGELWRLWTGHLAHWSGAHLAWDLAMFVALGATIERASRARFVGLVALSASAVSASVLLLTPLETYRGLSGVDAALFVTAAIELAGSRSRRSWIGAAALGAFLVKVSIEVVTGRSIFVENLAPGVGNVPLAHLAGAAVALVAAGGRGIYVSRRVLGIGGLA